MTRPAPSFSARSLARAVARRLALVLWPAALIAAPALAETSRDTMPQIFTMSPTGVNLQSGIFIHSETDISIGSLAFVRSWRTVPTFTPSPGGIAVFGGWDHNFLFGAQWHPGTSDGVDVYADGKVYQFRINQYAQWMPWNIDQHNNNAFGAELTGTIGVNLVFRNQNGDVYTMNANNQATRIDYADGSRIDLSYDTSKRPRAIISNRGYAIVLVYNANGRLATACGFNRAVTYVDSNSSCAGAQVTVSYTYSTTTAAQGWVLSSVTGADGQTSSYQYDTYQRPNLTCIMIPGTSTCRITNVYGPQPGDPEPPLTRPDQVRRQTTATGEVWQYFYLNADLYQDWPPLVFGEVRLTETDMTAPDGGITHVDYENGFVKRVYAPEGLTQYSWAQLNPSVFTRPAGNSETLVHDLRSNVTLHRHTAVPGSGLANIESTAAYPDSAPQFFVTGCIAASQKLCNKPIYRVDANGNRTDFTYAAEHGGMLTETGPAVPTKQADGSILSVRSQTRYTYAQRYARVKDSGGFYVNASAPVWVLTQKSICKVGPASGAGCAVAGDEVRTTYEYGPDSSGPNNLLLRGEVLDPGGLNLRTCYAYDALGNKISETRPNANLASCP